MKDQQKKHSAEMVREVLSIIEEINHLKDVNTILDRILTEARRLSNADAGTIFLIEDDKLKFSYIHNDTLFKPGKINKAVYSDFSIPRDKTSIVGYASITGETVVIDDAYKLPSDLPYKYNTFFDQETGYRCKSIMAIPLKTFQNKIVGVMQIINALDENNHPVPFSQHSRTILPLLANNASVAVERGIMTRELVLRMVKMSELRDPSETGAHVQRVGAYSAEIYHQWALNKGLPLKEIKKQKDLIRIAAMLHDVGKVGISDMILKKPAKLTSDEQADMKYHTVYGARLFLHSTSELDKMSFEIALNHHEKWNGLGYPGRIDDVFREGVRLMPGKKDEEIPLVARIAALADVFDALSSKRAYKEEWPDDKILRVIKEESGHHFDPDIVDAFLDIYDVIVAIREMYKEEPAGDGK